MKDVMIDIETLGTKPGCVILSVGAVKFDLESKEIGDEKLWVIDAEKLMRERGAKIDLSTVMFWIKQNADSGRHIFEATEKHDIDSVIKGLREFTNGCERFWAKGPDFDMAIIDEFCSKTYEPYMAPWKYNQKRCVRTAIDLGNSVAADAIMKEWTGIKHSPIADCLLQINQIFAAQS